VPGFFRSSEYLEPRTQEVATGPPLDALQFCANVESLNQRKPSVSKQITSLSRADFRLHLGHVPREPHWLLNHLYGRVLLASELRRVRPDLQCPLYSADVGQFAHLERMVDRLDLRKWPRPVGWFEHLRVTGLLVRMFWTLDMGQKVPNWRNWMERPDCG
jgi:hypothetical protein